MTRSGKAYLLAPLVYIGVILALLFLQFSGGERFTRSVGPLTLNATRSATPEEGASRVREIDLVFEGLGFSFGEESGLIVETASDVNDVRVTDYQAYDDGFELRFDGGYGLRLTIATDPTRELQVRVTLPEDANDVRELALPFTLSGAAEASTPTATSFASVVMGSDEFYFTTPPNALIDLTNRKIVLEPAAAGQAIRYVEATEADPARVVGWFEDGSLAISDAALAETIDAFVDAAYAGWASGRLNAAQLTWDGPAGFAAFSEEALTAYLAEAWERNEYERAFAEMRRARDLYPDALSLLSAPFLGNLREIRARYLVEDAERAGRISEMLDEGDLSVYREESLFLFAADRGGEDLYTRLIDFTRALDFRRLDVSSALGLLRDLFLDPLPDGRARDLSLRSIDLIQLKVLPSIVRTESGFYVQTSPGQIDLYQTAIAGAVLDAYGASRNDALMTAVGRNLLTSVLRRADARGMVPSTLVVRGETVDAADGLIAPERLYPIVAPAPSYPRQRSLYAEAGSGAWIWSIVPVAPTRITSSEWRFELTYPRLRTHYVIVQGVPAFERMELFGQTWRNAPDFEIYSKGRHYNAETDTLMVKYYDDSVRRPMVIYF